jgi:hypothetical protein
MGLVSMVLLSCSTLAAASVTTADFNIQRTRANTSEVILTQANVASSFHKKCTYSVDGYVYGHPLILDGVNFSGVTRVLLIVTMNNSIYAFNANACTTNIWTVNLGSTYPTDSSAGWYGLGMGILCTPVIDTTTNVVYFTTVNSSGVWKLYALNIADGSTYHAAVTISATASSVTFNSATQAQRPGLALANGNIYISFGSYGDLNTWKGWEMAYDKTSLAQTAAWVSTPTGTDGSIWLAGQAPAIDASGNIILATANGTYDGTTNWGDSFIKFNSSLTILDWATPANQSTLNASDIDLGMRVLLTGAYIMGTGKDGRWWVLNAAAMGKLQGGGGNPAIAQVFQMDINGCDPSMGAGCMYVGATFANNVLYSGPVGAKLSAYTWSGSAFTTTPAVQSSSTFAYPGATPSYSSNGSVSSTEILWATTVSSSAESTPQAGTLRAFNPATMAEIYNSDTAGAGADALGIFVRFTPPVVINGRVYVGTSNSVVEYSLPDSAYVIPSNLVGGATVAGGQVVR